MMNRFEQIKREIEMRKTFVGDVATSRHEEILLAEIEILQEELNSFVDCPRCGKKVPKNELVDGMCEECKMDFAIYYANDTFEPVPVRACEYDPENPDIHARFEEAMIAEQCNTGLYDDLEFYDRYLNDLMESEMDKYWKNFEY